MGIYVDAAISKGQVIKFYHLVSGTEVQFPAFLTQFEDSFTSDWNEETVFGRMDAIATFKRTGRKINLGWDIVAGSIQESVGNLAKISKLTRMLYPSYIEHGEEGSITSSTHIAGPPLMKLRLMNLVRDAATTSGDGSGATAADSGLLGYVNGFSTAPMLEHGFIEGPAGAIYPKSYQMSCTFTVLHTHDLGWNSGGNFRDGSTEDAGSSFPYRQDDSFDAVADAGGTLVGKLTLSNDGAAETEAAESTAAGATIGTPK